MYIIPNSTIQYFTGVNLSPGHENSLYFADEAAKTAAFDALVSPDLTETAVSYIYKDRPAFRSALPISRLYNVRYMRFRNLSFEDKWFYAFVTSVDYVNNGLTEVTFEIDDLVTWMGSFTISPCLVIREHTAKDNPYEHNVEEDLPTGDYILSGREEIHPASGDPYLVLSVARASDTVGSVGMYKGNVLSGAEYKYYPVSAAGVTDLQDDIDALIDDTKQDAMISAQLVYQGMIPSETETTRDGLDILANFTGQIKSSDLAFGTYTPKNKKLFSYPYCVMSVFNGEGSEQEFRYEFFLDHVAHFYMFGIATDVPELAILPTRYKQSGITYNEDQMMVMKQWPQASIAVDQYRAWVAQMTSGGGWISVMGKAASTIAGGIGAALTGNLAGVAGSVTGLASQAAGILAEKTRFEAMPDAVQGTANSSILYGINSKYFIIYHRQITEEYARIIDDYFTAYGYKVNIVKTPSMANRPQFTFLQTYLSHVSGALPASAARTIEEILDHGCRFWRNISDIGNLTVNNAPT